MGSNCNMSTRSPLHTYPRLVPMAFFQSSPTILATCRSWLYMALCLCVCLSIVLPLFAVARCSDCQGTDRRIAKPSDATPGIHFQPSGLAASPDAAQSKAMLDRVAGATEASRARRGRLLHLPLHGGSENNMNVTAYCMLLHSTTCSCIVLPRAVLLLAWYTRCCITLHGIASHYMLS